MVEIRTEKLTDAQLFERSRWNQGHGEIRNRVLKISPRDRPIPGPPFSQLVQSPPHVFITHLDYPESS